MIGCGGVQEQIKSKGRGVMLQGSFPVQTGPAGIQSPRTLPPPTFEMEPGCDILGFLPSGITLLNS